MGHAVPSHGVGMVPAIQGSVSLDLEDPPGYVGDRPRDTKINCWDRRKSGAWAQRDPSPEHEGSLPGETMPSLASEWICARLFWAWDMSYKGVMRKFWGTRVGEWTSVSGKRGVRRRVVVIGLERHRDRSDLLCMRAWLGWPRVRALPAPSPLVLVP